jgi:hypothetical protein
VEESVHNLTQILVLPGVGVIHVIDINPAGANYPVVYELVLLVKELGIPISELVREYFPRGVRD